MLMWQGQSVRRPVFPPSELIPSPFRRSRRACRRGPRQHQERTIMPLYEHVFLARQDASTQQVEELTTQLKSVLEGLGGKVVKLEQWGMKSLSYRMRKNRKAHYTFFEVDAQPAALQQI